jgi:hypothetical protein
MRRWIFLLGVGLLAGCAAGPYDYAVASPDYYDYGPYYYGARGTNLYLAPPGFHHEYDYRHDYGYRSYPHAPPRSYGRATPPPARNSR